MARRDDREPMTQEEVLAMAVFLAFVLGMTIAVKSCVVDVAQLFMPV